MQRIKDIYKNINNKIINLTSKKFFNEIYAAILAVITVLGWKFDNNIGMIVMILLTGFAIILTNDLKYVIPNVIFFIFIFGKGFANNEMPIPIIVAGAFFIGILLIYTIKEGIHFKKMKSLYGFLGMAIANLIPIFWCTAIQKGNEVMYFLYFGNLGYLLLYMIMSNGIKKNGLELLSISMSYLGLIMAAECAFKVYELKDSVDHILKLWYYLGWGLCNEAGIMICVSIPFIFYLIGKSNSIYGMLFQHTKLLLVLVGVLLTTSRGSYLFCFIETAVLYIVLLFTAKKTRLYQNLFLIFGFIVLIVAVIFKDYIIKVGEDVYNLVFTYGLDDNGRKALWVEGYQFWNTDWKTRIFGSGMVSSTRPLGTSGGFQEASVVFHSTLIETLTAGGLIGFAALCYHLYNKYGNLKSCDKLFFITVGIGYIVVDLYGLIDNTYHMYYYMIPLVTIMAVIDTALPDKESIEVSFKEI